VFGTVIRDEQGMLWLRTDGDRELWFEIPPEIGAGLLVDERSHLAKVSTDATGALCGPAEALEEGFRGSDDDFWEKVSWARHPAMLTIP
jgi:hypothetical protein